MNPSFTSWLKKVAVGLPLTAILSFAIIGICHAADASLAPIDFFVIAAFASGIAVAVMQKAGFFEKNKRN